MSLFVGFCVCRVCGRARACVYICVCVCVPLFGSVCTCGWVLLPYARYARAHRGDAEQLRDQVYVDLYAQKPTQYIYSTYMHTEHRTLVRKSDASPSDSDSTQYTSMLIGLQASPRITHDPGPDSGSYPNLDPNAATPIHQYSPTRIHPCTHTPIYPYMHAPIHPCTHTPIPPYTHTTKNAPGQAGDLRSHKTSRHWLAD